MPYYDPQPFNINGATMINGLIFSLILFTQGQPHVAIPDLTLEQCEQWAKAVKPVTAQCKLTAIGV